MIKDLLRRKEINARAARIAGDIIQRYPPEMDEKKIAESKADIKKKNTKLLKALNFGRAEIRKTSGEMKLGIYGKARLCKSIQEIMLEKDYSPDAVKMIIEQLAVTI